MRIVLIDLSVEEFERSPKAFLDFVQGIKSEGVPLAFVGMDSRYEDKPAAIDSGSEVKTETTVGDEAKPDLPAASVTTPKTRKSRAKEKTAEVVEVMDTLADTVGGDPEDDLAEVPETKPSATLEEVIAAATKLVNEGKSAAIASALKTMGISRVRDCPKDKLADLLIAMAVGG